MDNFAGEGSYLSYYKIIFKILAITKASKYSSRLGGNCLIKN